LLLLFVFVLADWDTEHKQYNNQMILTVCKVNVSNAIINFVIILLYILWYIIIYVVHMWSCCTVIINNYKL